MPIPQQAQKLLRFFRNSSSAHWHWQHATAVIPTPIRRLMGVTSGTEMTPPTIFPQPHRHPSDVTVDGLAGVFMLLNAIFV